MRATHPKMAEFQGTKARVGSIRVQKVGKQSCCLGRFLLMQERPGASHVDAAAIGQQA